MRLQFVRRQGISTRGMLGLCRTTNSSRGQLVRYVCWLSLPQQMSGLQVPTWYVGTLVTTVMRLYGQGLQEIVGTKLECDLPLCADWLGKLEGQVLLHSCWRKQPLPRDAGWTGRLVGSLLDSMGKQTGVRRCLKTHGTGVLWNGSIREGCSPLTLCAGSLTMRDGCGILPFTTVDIADPCAFKVLPTTTLPSQTAGLSPESVISLLVIKICKHTAKP